MPVFKVCEPHLPHFLHTLISLQGTSKAALDVLTGVASEYLLNVGRTIHFLSEKYGKKMPPEVSSG